MDIQSELSSLCRLITLKSAKRYHDWLFEQGVTLGPEQTITISTIAKSVEFRQGDLMALPYLASEKSKVSRIVQSLVMEGYINRRDDINDRRSKILTLTDKGQAMADLLSKADQRNFETIHALLSEEEAVSLRSTLTKVAHAI
ncbi:MarR family winged helix-turn-helix transcriptional regulator [Enterovibrio nigricans]|uniref:DNA-binding transcriptional regulator, MarR family n=1 Tax=Enterovibrio nigricans DSM 22720 TaxID=1121868 RepID=A0A1T4UWN0_9GAMM|nr:MarR family winged helix-turn-helix transcriptional regulator [Enterovibrio nigricans]PKF50837.1 MarR family transcriptional regulator [Enterovibrio nigricans]SKA57102.1 DNA-binding transcriptional regulator, MarR family [Enterovibrio nigricans DSM 22720]